VLRTASSRGADATVDGCRDPGRPEVCHHLEIIGVLMRLRCHIGMRRESVAGVSPCSEPLVRDCRSVQVMTSMLTSKAGGGEPRALVDELHSRLARCIVRRLPNDGEDAILRPASGARRRLRRPAASIG